MINKTEHQVPDFTPVGEMLEAQNEYIKEQSNINNFIEDMYDECGEGNVVLKTDIKTNYDHWCKENSIKPLKMSALYSALDDKFGKSMKYQHKGDYKNKWVYKGLKNKIEESNNDLDA